MDSLKGMSLATILPQRQDKTTGEGSQAPSPGKLHMKALRMNCTMESLRSRVLGMGWLVLVICCRCFPST